MFEEFLFLVYNSLCLLSHFLPSNSSLSVDSIEVRTYRKVLLLSPINIALFLVQLLCACFAIRNGYSSLFMGLSNCQYLNWWRNWCSRKILLGENRQTELMLFGATKLWNTSHSMGRTGLMQLIYGHYYFFSALNAAALIDEEILLIMQIAMVSGMIYVILAFHSLIGENYHEVQLQMRGLNSIVCITRKCRSLHLARQQNEGSDTCSTDDFALESDGSLLVDVGERNEKLVKEWLENCHELSLLRSLSVLTDVPLRCTTLLTELIVSTGQQPVPLNDEVMAAAW